jgi:DNA-binding transcriptional regulator LsrR (DeoR family)
MTKYREILRLHSLGFSQQNIAYSSNVSKKTVNRVINRANELNISWPLDDSQTDAVLEQILSLPIRRVKSRECRTLPTSARSC